MLLVASWTRFWRVVHCRSSQAAHYRQRYRRVSSRGGPKTDTLLSLPFAT
jgi:hypothetical protein